MGEDQLNLLPPDLRSMVMSASSAMMNGGVAPQSGMMDIGMMNMNVNMGMGGDMSMMGGMGMGMDIGQQDSMIHGQHDGFPTGMDYNGIQHADVPVQPQPQQMYHQLHSQVDSGPTASLTPTPGPPSGPAASRGLVAGRGNLRGTPVIRGRGNYPRGGRKDSPQNLGPC